MPLTTACGDKEDVCKGASRHQQCKAAGRWTDSQHLQTQSKPLPLQTHCPRDVTGHSRLASGQHLQTVCKPSCNSYAAPKQQQHYSGLTLTYRSWIASVMSVWRSWNSRSATGPYLGSVAFSSRSHCSRLSMHCGL